MMIMVFDQWCKIQLEKIAKGVMQHMYIDKLLTDVFQGVMMAVRYPGNLRSTQWCESVLNRGSCYAPNGRFCNGDCFGDESLSTPCPPGYHTSLAWGFQVTGCWCDNFRGRGVVCCDCTPIGNSSYQRTMDDCGCMHVYN